MKRACIAVVDAASARIFTYQQLDGRPPDLVEQQDLVSPGRRAKDGDLFSEHSPGARNTENSFGSTDDHRDAHRANWDTSFANAVGDEVERIAAHQGFSRIIVVAPPKMLGHLRRPLEALRKHGFDVEPIERDLTHLSAPQIHDHLADMKLIDPRHRARM